MSETRELRILRKRNLAFTYCFRVLQNCVSSTSFNACFASDIADVISVSYREILSVYNARDPNSYLIADDLDTFKSDVLTPGCTNGFSSCSIVTTRRTQHRQGRFLAPGNFKRQIGGTCFQQYKNSLFAFSSLSQWALGSDSIEVPAM